MNTGLAIFVDREGLDHVVNTLEQWDAPNASMTAVYKKLDPGWRPSSPAYGSPSHVKLDKIYLYQGDDIEDVNIRPYSAARLTGTTLDVLPRTFGGDSPIKLAQRTFDLDLTPYVVYLLSSDGIDLEDTPDLHIFTIKDLNEDEDFKMSSAASSSTGSNMSNVSNVSMGEIEDIHAELGTSVPAPVVVRDRVRLIEEIQSALNIADGDQTCIKNDTLKSSLKLIQRIGSASVNGEAFKTCFPIECSNGSCKCKDDAHYVAVKQIPIYEFAQFMKMKEHPTSSEALRDELWAELLSLRLCNALVENEICPNLPLYVKYVICTDGCKFENDRVNGKPCMILINELANAGDFKQWIKAADRSVDEWMSAYFQIFSGLYALQKYFDLTHHDLHWGNVLVHELPENPNRYFRYTIDDIVYDVPVFRWLFTLWDFGYARIPGVMEITEFKSYYQKPEQNPRELVDYLRISSAPSWAQSENRYPPIEIQQFRKYVEHLFEEGIPLQGVIRIFRDKYVPRSDHDIAETYSMDKPISMDRELYRFLRRGALAELRRPTPDELQARRDLTDKLQFDNALIPEWRGFPKVFSPGLYRPQSSSDIFSKSASSKSPLSKSSSNDLPQLKLQVARALHDVNDPVTVDQIWNANARQLSQLFGILSEIKLNEGMITLNDAQWFHEDPLVAVCGMFIQIVDNYVRDNDDWQLEKLAKAIRSTFDVSKLDSQMLARFGITMVNLGFPLTIDQFMAGTDAQLSHLFDYLLPIKYDLSLRTDEDVNSYRNNKLGTLVNMLSEITERLVAQGRTSELQMVAGGLMHFFSL